MRNSLIVIIIYALGLIFGAIVLGLWDAETSFIKSMIAVLWTAIFLIALFYTDKYEKK